MRDFPKLVPIPLAGILWAIAANAASVREVSRTLEFPEGGRLALETYRGSITILPGDDRRLEIHARVVLGSEAPEPEVQVDRSSGIVHVSSVSGGTSEAPEVHYTIRMPRNANLDLHDYQSAIRIDGLRSAVTVDTYKGCGTINGLRGSIDLKTYQGDILVDFENLEGGSRIETYRGAVAVRLPKDSRFKLTPKVGPEARFQSDFGVRAAGGPQLELKSYRGKLRLQSAPPTARPGPS